MTANLVIPDYAGACLSNITPALLEHDIIGSGWIPDSILKAKKVVLVLVDGLGYQQFQASEEKGLTPNLTTMDLQRIITVVPSTTATALTSLTTGRPPGEHGIVGYKVNAGNKVLNTLRWTAGKGGVAGEIDPSSFQPVIPFLGKEVSAISPAEFANSAFTSAHLRGADYQGYYLPSNMPELISNSLRHNNRLIYAYYDGLDKVGHIHGVGPYFDAEIAFIDYLVGAIFQALPSKTGLIVTADHGMVNVDDSVILIDDGIMDRTSFLSGEARFLWFHTERGVGDSLLFDLEDLYGDCAWVRSKEQILDEGWFGRQISNEAKRRLGDIALLARDPVAFAERGRAGPKLVGRHGSLTAAEMHVPLITMFKD